MAVAKPIQIRFERFTGETGIAPAKPPTFVAPEDKPALIERARRLLEQRNAVLVAHYYVHPDLQDLAQSSGGTVSDWRNYDSIYTERYMQTPQNNPEGYRKSSPVHFAKDLHGKLLLIHGAIDDNVHMANTIQFLYELQKSGKQVQLMIYPKSRHGVTDPALVKHMQQMMTDFILGNL